ncbi:hypothetical protein [Azospirillum endophyticum]
MPPSDLVADLLPGILAAQTPGGAFASTVWLADGPCPDENGFVTALVLNALDGLEETPALATARGRALDFLARCELPDRPGAFSFYPWDGHPDWMAVPLPADADDTALFALALVAGGRRDREWLTRVATGELRRFRLAWISGAAMPWHREGAVFTWLDERYYPNVIDLCVNINVAALLAATGQGEALGLPAIVAMVEDALDWAGPFPDKARLLSPYYPDPIEIAHALTRAVAQGVTEFRPSLARLRDLPWAWEDGTDDGGGRGGEGRPVCGSGDRRILWTAPVLRAARRLLVPAFRA